VNPFNPSQSRSIAVSFQCIHGRLADIEAMLVRSEVASQFSEYTPDLSPTEQRILRDYFGQVRAAMLALLQDCGIPLGVQRRSLRWGVQVHLGMIGVALADLGPRSLEGYGALGESAWDRAVRIRQELDRLVDRVYTFLARHRGPELAARLVRLGAAAGADELRLIDRVVTRWGLVAFHPQIAALARRLESPEFEIAVFGRVSSGKSSLLNHLADSDVLPVGVTPVTAVPTRLTRGDAAECIVTTAESGPRSVPVAELKEYASEYGNAGNHKHVTDILVRVPSPRLPDGIVLVDTPGVGSLAQAGTAEAMAYLPRCDLGVVLVDAASTLNADDLGLVQQLAEAGTPVQVLVSKADLLSPADQMRSLTYVRNQLHRETGTDVPVHAVSTVGAGEELLSRWFAEEIEPLFRRHRELVGESIRRKITGFRAAAAVVLQTMADRGSAEDGRGGLKSVGDARTLLEAADRAVQAARDRERSGYGAADLLTEQVLEEARWGSGTGAVAQAAAKVLSRRGQEALSLARDLQTTLARSLGELAATGFVAGVDPSAVVRVPLRGLPDADLKTLADDRNGRLPWWAAVPGLKFRALRSRFGASLRGLIDGYESALRLWLRAAQDQLIEAFESQAEVAREQARRLAAEPEGGTRDDQADLAADIGELLGNGLATRVGQESAEPVASQVE
jgi:GTP-binding protein EngB required for normal cell division